MQRHTTRRSSRRLHDCVPMIEWRIERKLKQTAAYESRRLHFRRHKRRLKTYISRTERLLLKYRHVPITFLDPQCIYLRLPLPCFARFERRVPAAGPSPADVVLAVVPMAGPSPPTAGFGRTASLAVIGGGRNLGRLPHKVSHCFSSLLPFAGAGAAAAKPALYLLAYGEGDRPT